jgi:dethiobiotin synthetase
VKSRFVTSTGTGIGKTLVTALLVRELRAAGEPVTALKPVISGYPGPPGEPSDTEILLRAQQLPVDAVHIEAISPLRFRAPLSPDMAAAREGRRIDLDALVDLTRERRARCTGWLLIEGVGGVAVPLGERHTVLDWMAAVGFPAILVTGSYLGTLSHTLTAATALRARGIELAGLVLSESVESPVPLAETRGTLLRFLGELPCAELARSSDPWKDPPPLARDLGLL